MAKSLTEADIIDAYRANRFYATQDWNTKVDFTINGEPMGGYVKQAASLEIKASISDDDASDSVKSIEVIYGIPGSGIAPKKLAVSKNATLNEKFEVEAGKAYYFFLKITQNDGDQIVTSPIWAKN